jgi:hypothetical protein
MLVVHVVITHRGLFGADVNHLESLGNAPVGADAFARAQEASKAVNRPDIWGLGPDSDVATALNTALNAYGDAAAKDIPR